MVSSCDKNWVNITLQNQQYKYIYHFDDFFFWEKLNLKMSFYKYIFSLEVRVIQVRYSEQ